MRAGTALSLNYVRRRATENMRSTCRIERVEPPAYNASSILASAGTRTTVYTGVCRIWEVGQAGMVEIGDTDYLLQATQLSIPWDSSPVPIRDDEIVVLTCDTDPDMVGRRYRITDVAKAGQFRPSRRFSISQITESDDWP